MPIHMPWKNSQKVTKKGIKLRVWESDVGQIGEFVYMWLGWVKIKEDLWK